MRISRFYSFERLNANKDIILGKEMTHYIKNVLRHGVGDKLLVFNPEDGEFAAVIKKATKTMVQIELHEQTRKPSEPKLVLHLGQGLVRGEKMDYIIQKATELGVTKITPLFTEHDSVKLNAERILKRTIHWQRIAINASEQCGRISIPDVVVPEKLINWLPERDEALKLLCHPTDKSLDASLKPESLVMLIGPEGGLSDHERDLARSVGFDELGLGPRILRTETASVVGLSLIQYCYGDVG